MNIPIYQKTIDMLVKELSRLSNVNGIFLSGSLVNRYQDIYSDIDLGVTTKNNASALEAVYSSRHQIVRIIQGFSHSLDRSWGNCKMIAALYNCTKFPLFGLEIDIVFSKLRNVMEQMPYADYKILFDESGELKELLGKIPKTHSKEDIRTELKQYFSWLPFYIYDIIKAHYRKDIFLFQNLLEEIRKMIYFVVALVNNRFVYGAKRAIECMTSSEIQLIKNSYRSAELEVVYSLLNLLLENLKKISLSFRIENDIKDLFRVLSEITNQTLII